MGLFSFLSASKVADAVTDSVPKVVNGVIGGIDAAFFTDEERQQMAQDLLKQLYDNFMPRAISRRILAVIIFVLFSIYALTALVFACLNMVEVVNRIIEVAEAIKLGWMAITVTIFYFGYYGFQKVFGGKGK